MLAAQVLKSGEYEFRAVGPANVSHEAQRRLRECLDLVDAVPRNETPHQYEWADVLVLPSVSEGSANVCYEALAAGVPVITTKNAGSVVRDGGYIRIQPVDDNAIQTQVGHEQEPVVGVEPHPVGMRLLLSSCHDSRASVVLDGFHRTSNRPVIGELEHGDRTAAVLGGEEKLARGMHRDVGAAAIRVFLSREFRERSVLFNPVAYDPGEIPRPGRRVGFSAVAPTRTRPPRAEHGCRIV